MQETTSSSASEDSAFDLRDVFRVIRKYWWAFPVAMFLGGLTGYGLSLTQPQVYQASSMAVVTAGSSDQSLGVALTADSLAKSKAASYATIAKSRSVAEEAKKILSKKNVSSFDSKSADDLVGMVAVQTPENTAQLTIDATSSDPTSARELADAWLAALQAKVTELETPSPSAAKKPTDQTYVGTSFIRLTSLESAQLPSSPTSPNRRLWAGVGVLAGLVLAGIYTLVRHQLDRRIRSIDTLTQNFAVPVIGTIPLEGRLKEKRALIAGSAKQGIEDFRFSESIRELRTNLTYTSVDHPPRVILLTSSIPGEGKSTISSNLAATIAQTGQPVVLIDCDLRRPVVTKTFNMVEGVGVTNILTGEASYDEVLQVWSEEENLGVIGAGRLPPNPSELLGSDAMARLIDSVADKAFVIIDAPPILPVTDAAVLSTRVDGIVVAVRAGTTTVDELDSALAKLQRVDANILGLVINRVPIKGADANRYGYYGKDYYYSSDQKKS